MFNHTVARMKCSKMRDQAKGFTLLELVICLALLSIIAFFSLAYTPSLYKKNQLQTVITEIKNAIHTAKMQALVMGKTLALTHLPGTSDWSQGMQLFVYNPQHQYTSNIKPLYEWRWKSTGVDVTWSGFQSNDFLLFATDLHSSATNGSFKITSNGQQTTLIVNRVGRVRKVS